MQTINNVKNQAKRKMRADAKCRKDFQTAMDVFHSGERFVALTPATGTQKSVTASMIWKALGGTCVYLNNTTAGLSNFMQFYGEEEGITIFSMTYRMLSLVHQNPERYAEKLEILKNCNLVIADEMHFLGAPKYRAAYEWLRDALNPTVYTLGLSATPRRMDQMHQAEDMVDEMFDGNRIGQCTLAEAIEMGILPQCTYVGFLYTLSEEIERKINRIRNSNRLSPEEMSGLVDRLNDLGVDWSRMHSMNVAVESYLLPKAKTCSQYGIGCKVLIFTKNYEHLQDVKQSLNPALLAELKDWQVTIKECHTIGGAQKGDAALRWFREPVPEGEVHILYAIDKLNDSVHFNDLNAIILLRDTQSIRIFAQQIGRVFSPSSIDEHPLILDMVNNLYHLSNLEGMFGPRTGEGGNPNAEGRVEYQNGQNQVYFIDTLLDAQRLLNAIDEWAYIKFEVDGERNTIMYFCNKWQVNYSFVLNKVKMEGLDLKTALTIAPKVDNTVYTNHNTGFVGNLREHAKKNGMPVNLLKYMISSGMTLEAAVEDWNGRKRKK